ncbi:MAG: IS1 family transposase [Beijerinckiaceae bacterium]|nr:IS1 family transposase [Beijerinckiaceae bacterium]
MNKLPLAKRAQVISALMEGVGVNAASRMTGVSKPTILKLVADLGAACAQYHDKHVRNVKAKRIQCDEIWSFCYAKAKNVPAHLKGQFGVGDVWNWIGLESQSKLVISWLVGSRDAECAYEFMSDIAARVEGRIQLTTDGHAAYLEAIDQSFGIDIDYAMLIKHYGESADHGPERKYSPSVCTGCHDRRITGKPDARHVSTSHVERLNLSVRMQNRRYTRLTNGHSKKIENHIHHLAIYFIFYNFARVHSSLRMSPAMAAGVETRLWEVEDVVKLVD